MVDTKSSRILCYLKKQQSNICIKIGICIFLCLLLCFICFYFESNWKHDAEQNQKQKPRNTEKLIQTKYKKDVNQQTAQQIFGKISIKPAVDRGRSSDVVTTNDLLTEGSGNDESLELNDSIIGASRHDILYFKERLLSATTMEPDLITTTTSTTTSSTLQSPIVATVLTTIEDISQINNWFPNDMAAAYSQENHIDGKSRDPASLRYLDFDPELYKYALREKLVNKRLIQELPPSTLSSSSSLLNVDENSDEVENISAILNELIFDKDEEIRAVEEVPENTKSLEFSNELRPLALEEIFLYDDTPEHITTDDDDISEEFIITDYGTGNKISIKDEVKHSPHLTAKFIENDLPSIENLFNKLPNFFVPITPATFTATVTTAQPPTQSTLPPLSKLFHHHHQEPRQHQEIGLKDIKHFPENHRSAYYDNPNLKPSNVGRIRGKLHNSDTMLTTHQNVGINPYPPASIINWFPTPPPSNNYLIPLQRSLNMLNSLLNNKLNTKN